MVYFGLFIYLFCNKQQKKTLHRKQNKISIECDAGSQVLSAAYIYTHYLYINFVITCVIRKNTHQRRGQIDSVSQANHMELVHCFSFDVTNDTVTTNHSEHVPSYRATPDDGKEERERNRKMANAARWVWTPKFLKESSFPHLRFDSANTDFIAAVVIYLSLYQADQNAT